MREQCSKCGSINESGFSRTYQPHRAEVPEKKWWFLTTQEGISERPEQMKLSCLYCGFTTFQPCRS